MRELDIVYLGQRVTGFNSTAYSGESGTVVHVYPSGTAVEVEFQNPNRVITVPLVAIIQYHSPEGGFVDGPVQ